MALNSAPYIHWYNLDIVKKTNKNSWEEVHSLLRLQVDSTSSKVEHILRIDQTMTHVPTVANLDCGVIESSQIPSTFEPTSNFASSLARETSIGQHNKNMKRVSEGLEEPEVKKNKDPKGCCTV